MYKSLIITVLPLISLCAMEHDAVKIDNVITPQQLGKIALYHKAQKFYVEKNNQQHEIKSYDVDQKIRTISPEQLAKFQKAAYFHLKQMDNGDFSLTAHARGLGGGPLTASALYWLTKVTCWGTVAAATSAAVVTTGGAVAGALGVAGTAGAGAVTAVAAKATGGVMAGVVGASSTGVGLTAAAISGAGLTTEATLATGAMVSSSAGLVGGIEAAAAGMWAVGLWLPLP